MAHTQFKEQLRQELQTRCGAVIEKRCGPSFDERCKTAVAAFKTKAKASEAEQRKTLQGCIERGRAKPTSAVHRDASDAPDQEEMLKNRVKAMKEGEQKYKEELEALKLKMDRRRPLFSLADVSEAFEMQKRRQEEKRRQLSKEEAERWEHIRELEHSAHKRPLLVEDYLYKAPSKSQSTPELLATMKPPIGPAGFGTFESDQIIKRCISQPWFDKTEWGQKVRQIEEAANNRVKLHELDYGQKIDGKKFARTRLMHKLPGKLPPVIL
eukprot:TRINITY_DN15073_c3_g1_i1.p1 TRINITY_DN15073_c3_g1~~TRINITY_DN15073_c3_g1_i1.p1  ORF type:complete len:268 (-),score=61.65 TRINITY_DN15073_c3_g1_i1:88-891(-)